MNTPKQTELFGHDVGGFRLVSLWAVDGDRVARERERKEREQAEFEAAQVDLTAKEGE